MAAIDRLVVRVMQSGGSDLHLSAGHAPWLRRNGQLAALANEPAVAAEQLETWLKEVAPKAKWEQMAEAGDATFAHQIAGQARVRVHCYRQTAGLAAVCRVIPLTPPALADMGLAPVLTDLCQQRAGLLIIAGPTGAGVSTTVAALCQEINQHQARRVLTLEHPIEYVFAPQRCAFVQREVGAGQGLADALRDAGRAGFDVISVGELHTSETTALALGAAESGALVLATVRSSSVVRTLDHTVNAFGSEQQPWARGVLANALRGVCVQLLVPKADGTGRCAVNEMLVCTSGVASAIREGHISKLGSMIQSGGGDGMMTLDDSLMKKVDAKVITPEEAITRANDKLRFQAHIKAAEPPPPGPGAPAAPAKGPPTAAQVHVGGRTQMPVPIQKPPPRPGHA
jgi:twitching motility protein PilT